MPKIKNFSLTHVRSHGEDLGTFPTPVFTKIRDAYHFFAHDESHILHTLTMAARKETQDMVRSAYTEGLKRIWNTASSTHIQDKLHEQLLQKIRRDLGRKRITKLTK